MAYLDHSETAFDKRCKEKYEELKISLKDNENSFHNALHHIRDMEEELKTQEKQIAEYRKFFNLLQKLLPKQFSSHDIIG